MREEYHMAKDEKARAPEPDGMLAVAVRKKAGRFQVFTVSRKDGKQVEEVLKDTEDKRIAADRIQQAVIGVRW